MRRLAAVVAALAAGCGAAPAPEAERAEPEPAAAAPVEDRAVAEITESAIVFGGEVLGSGIDWQLGTPEPFAALRRLAAAVEGQPGPVELRIHDPVPGYFVWLLAAEVPAVWRRAIYARRIGDGWRVVQPSPPGDGGGDAAGLDIEVDAREIHLVVDGYALPTLAAPPGGHDFTELAVALAELRAGPLAGRTEARVVPIGGTFGDLARALEVARGAGLTGAVLWPRPER